MSVRLNVMANNLRRSGRIDRRRFRPARLCLLYPDALSMRPMYRSAVRADLVGGVILCLSLCEPRQYVTALAK